MEKRHFLSGATATILMLTLKNLVGMWYLIIGTRCFFSDVFVRVLGREKSYEVVIFTTR